MALRARHVGGSAKADPRVAPGREGLDGNRRLEQTPGGRSPCRRGSEQLIVECEGEHRRPRWRGTTSSVPSANWSRPLASRRRGRTDPRTFSQPVPSRGQVRGVAEKLGFEVAVPGLLTGGQTWDRYLRARVRNSAEKW